MEVTFTIKTLAIAHLCVLYDELYEEVSYADRNSTNNCDTAERSVGLHE
jgi:hypothetical protein